MSRVASTLRANGVCRRGAYEGLAATAGSAGTDDNGDLSGNWILLGYVSDKALNLVANQF